MNQSNKALVYRQIQVDSKTFELVEKLQSALEKTYGVKFSKNKAIKLTAQQVLQKLADLKVISL